MICPFCGKENTDSVERCFYCAHKLEKNYSEEEIENNSAAHTRYSKKDVIEWIIATILFLVAIGVFIHYMINDPWGNMLNIIGVGILGAIGLLAAILSIGFEGSFPVPIKLLFGCSAILLLAVEFPIFTPFLIFLYVVCIYFLYISYDGRLSGVALGSVAIICLPFWGVILILLIDMFFSGAAGGSSSSQKNKK